MKNMQNFQGFHAECFGCIDKKNSVLCVLSCMTKMQNVRGFYSEENSVLCIIVCLKKHDKFGGLSCMTNMQNFHGTDD